MKYLVFMRSSGRRCPQSRIGDMPFDDISTWSINNPDPFIIVSVTDQTLEENKHLLGNRGLKLKIDKLRAQYPDTTEEYKDDDGNSQILTNYGYFSESGRTNKESIVGITIDDVEVVDVE